ncbi:uncharacterized protein LOC131641849 [Vicia villosa]|uniref:uncharacterized protein LOC131641849 n=1 Tax=Vicia villosa TaxID=3911 RepID=UPI00273C1B4A|nr:uncharacterized protein LOC131641849 [Vicia villosa]
MSKGIHLSEPVFVPALRSEVAPINVAQTPEPENLPEKAPSESPQITHVLTPPSPPKTNVTSDHSLETLNDLKERFAKADCIRVSNLRVEINNFKQGTKPVLDYFTELRGLWEELNSHRPIPSCTCVHQCRCEAMYNARDFRFEDQIIQFLTGLNDKFSVIKTQVLLLDPLPSINKVYSRVIQEESNNISLLPKPDTTSNIDEANTLVNTYDSRKQNDRGKSSNSYSGHSNSNKDSRMCTFCNRSGHAIDVCYRKHGFPPNFTKKQSSANASIGDTQPLVSTSEEGHTNNPIASITQDQYAQLISLLKQTNLLPLNTNTNPSANHISIQSSHTPITNSGKLFVSTVSCSSHTVIP